MASQQWSLADRLKALRLPVLDRERLESMTPTKRNNLLLTFGRALSTNGKSLYAITRIPQIWPTLSQLEKDTCLASKVASNEWLSLSSKKKDYFILKTGELRGGNINALFEVLDRYSGRQATLSQATQPMTPAAVPAPKGSTKAIMSLQSRLAIAKVCTFDPSKMCAMRDEEKDAYVKKWCQGNLNANGRTLFMLRKAPEYMTMSDKRKAKESLVDWSKAQWRKMSEEHTRPYKAATAELHRGDLEVFLQKLTKMLGNLPDLQPSLPYFTRTKSSSIKAMTAPSAANTATTSRVVITRSMTLASAAKKGENAQRVNSLSKPLRVTITPQKLPVAELPDGKQSKSGPASTTTEDPYVNWNVPDADRATVSARSREIKPLKAKARTRNGESVIEVSRSANDVRAAVVNTQVLKETSEHESDSETTTSRTPVLDSLVPGHSGASQKLVSQVLEALKERIFPRGDKVLVGRIADGSRIDYSPLVTGITGISSRLGTAASAEHPLDAMETVLQPLARWNKGSMFPELHAADLAGVQSTKGHCAYESTWLLHSLAYMEVAPIKRAGASEVIDVVFDSIRARYRNVKGDNAMGLLALDRYLEPLIHCFFGPETFSEVYEDRIEVVLYRLEAELSQIDESLAELCAAIEARL